MAKVTFAASMVEIAAQYEGVSDRLLNLASTCAIAYLAGVNGWGENATKMKADAIRDQILEVMGTLGNKRSTAYQFAKTGFDLAVRLNKGDAQFRATLKEADSVADAVALVVAQIKNDWKCRTMDALKEYLKGGKAAAEKPKATPAERIVKLLTAEGAEFTEAELTSMLAAMIGHGNTETLIAFRNVVEREIKARTPAPVPARKRKVA